MRLGLFGGSFDPIHSGHIEPVKTARRELDLDQVIYLPTARPPHKQRQVLVSPIQRYSMVEIALLEEPECVVSPFEMGTDRPAFAVDSVRHYRAKFPQAELFLIMGSDSFDDLEQWRDWREIVSLARIAVLVRRGAIPHDLAALPYAPELVDLVRESQAVLVHNETVAVSSSELRNRLARGENLPEGWMPKSVIDYIQKYSLYR